MDLQTLTTDEVLKIHEALVRDFTDTGDPISPPGMRDMDLLESAVARQLVGHGRELKYSTPIQNAATLLYGLCCDHPFYNGNKRTALVAMLVHLDKNRLTLFHTTQDDLYELMIRVAEHSLEAKGSKRSRAKHTLGRPSADEEVEAVANWLSERADRIRRGEKFITYRELRRILVNFGYALENPHNNSIDVVRLETIRKGFLRRPVEVKKRIGNISWPGEHRDVGIKEIKRVRGICRLREEDGVDSDAFYNYTFVVDAFVNKYRRVLRRLARA